MNIETTKAFLTTTGVNILIAIVVLFIGLKISNFIVKRITKNNGEKGS